MAAIPAPSAKQVDINPALDALVSTMRLRMASLAERIEIAAGDINDGNPLAAIGALSCAEQMMIELQALMGGAMALGRVGRGR